MLGIHRRGLHGAGERFQSVGRTLGLKVTNSELAPGVGILRVFHHDLLPEG